MNYDITEVCSACVFYFEMDTGNAIRSSRPGLRPCAGRSVGAPPSAAAGGERRAPRSSCLSGNTGADRLLSAKSTGRTHPVTGNTQVLPPAPRTVCCLPGEYLGLKMVIRVYVASSTGSVAVSVYKPGCDTDTFLPLVLNKKEKSINVSVLQM